MLISAGETSGEMYAARLASALIARTGAQLFGLGSEKMRAAGVDVVADYHSMAVVGIFEVIAKLPAVWRNWRRMEKEAVATQTATRDPGRFPRLSISGSAAGSANKVFR